MDDFFYWLGNGGELEVDNGGCDMETCFLVSGWWKGLYCGGERWRKESL